MSQENNTNTTSETIPSDVLEKAFAILDIAKSKSEEETEKKDNAKEEADEVEKAKACYEMAKSLVISKSNPEGKSRGQAIDHMVIEKGIPLEEAKSAVEKVIAEFQAQQNGGDVVTETITKSETPTPIVATTEEGFDFQKSFGEVTSLLTESKDSLEKANSNQDNLLKAFDSLTSNLDTKFSALGEVLKKSFTDNSELAKKVETLTKSLSESQKRLEEIATTPIPSKALNNTRGIERFAKSQTENGELSISRDKQTILDQIDTKIQQQRTAGRDTRGLEKAMADLEITKGFDPQDLSLLKSHGFSLTE